MRAPRAVRRLVLALACCTAFFAAAATAAGHAELAGSSPAAATSVEVPPEQVTLTFTEPVQVLAADNLDVVDSEGEPVSSGPGRVLPDDASIAEVPLRPDLPDGTYTVRYRIIGADSHIIPGFLTFGVGSGEVGEPFTGASTSTGPSEASVWGVSSRFLELVGLGGLIGLLAFRWLVWAPATRRASDLSDGERTAALEWGRDNFWVAFGVLAVGAMIAEGYLLVVQSASALGVGVWAALGDATGISQVLGDTRFGSLVQVRGALLFSVFALGAVQFIREYGSSAKPRPPRATGGLPTSIAMGALLLAVLGGIAAQGHPSVAPFPALQVGAQIVHIASVAVWITGLALVAIAFLRLPKVAPDGGPALAAHLLARFSKVALAAVVLAVATGVARSVVELSGPEELWATGYGRSIVYKLLLLCPVALLALYNRRVVAALRRVARPNRPTLRLVRRTAAMELTLSIAIVVVAALLVAQVPGGS